VTCEDGENIACGACGFTRSADWWFDLSYEVAKGNFKTLDEAIDARMQSEKERSEKIDSALESG
jgi:hypothetical protein